MSKMVSNVRFVNERTTHKPHELLHQDERQGATLVNRVGRLSIAVEPDRVVPADEEEEASKTLPGNLNDDIGQHEG